MCALHASFSKLTLKAVCCVNVIFTLEEWEKPETQD